MDKLASPINSPQPNPPANVPLATPMPEGTTNTSENDKSNLPSDVDTHTDPQSLPVKPVEHTQSCPTNLPGADDTHHGQSTSSPPSQAPDQHINPTSEGGPTSSQGGETISPSQSLIIKKDQLYELLQPDTETNTRSTSTVPDSSLTEPMVSPSHQHFTSILSNSRPTPRIPPEDRVSSTKPNHKIVTTEYFQKCFDFRNINPILKNLEAQSKNTVTVQDTSKHPILSRSETATLSKYRTNSQSIPKPPKYGQVWHYDIVYGNRRAISSIYYILFFIDRKSRQKKILGLKDLKKETLQRAIKTFVRKVGFYPDKLIADRDFKIIGSHIDDIMEPYTQVSGAPGGWQTGDIFVTSPEITLSNTSFLPSFGFLQYHMQSKYQTTSLSKPTTRNYQLLTLKHTSNIPTTESYFCFFLLHTSKSMTLQKEIRLMARPSKPSLLAMMTSQMATFSITPSPKRFSDPVIIA